ncbi:MAG: NfeD family protein [Spirochaetaceae bacterium]|nr:NfeD family protein [Spirochaetaceae bacterium]
MGRRIRIFDGFTLKTRITGTAGGPDPDSPAVSPGTAAPEGLPPGEGEDYTPLAGKRGIAATTLRPSGKAEIEGRLLVVEADGAFIEQGSPVRVIRVRGNRIIVNAV